eukprot:comp24326_c0_seq5/m.45955 comp24326_c0_seq5/g.45955  ORF comp24326_c0_seq5/g.45955 comp24326_c0_seq5/m.45955 type:complete len:279 (-) comp24326_c0_seq5:50-886(-)
MPTCAANYCKNDEETVSPKDPTRKIKLFTVPYGCKPNVLARRHAWLNAIGRQEQTKYERKQIAEHTKQAPPDPDTHTDTRPKASDGTDVNTDTTTTETHTADTQSENANDSAVPAEQSAQEPQPKRKRGQPKVEVPWPLAILKQLVVCEAHFTDDDITVKNGKLKLTKDACPIRMELDPMYREKVQLLREERANSHMQAVGMDASDIEQTRKRARERGETSSERAFGGMKNYRLFSNQVQMSMVGTHWMVAKAVAFLCNMQEPLYKDMVGPGHTKSMV